MRKGRWLRAVITGAVIVFTALNIIPANASSANISRSFMASEAIPNGSIVSMDPTKPDFVVPANTSNAAKLVGVSLASDESLLAVDATEGEVQVATSGTVSVFVSTVNGVIEVGDQISASPFNGLGMKALPGSRIVGLAQTSLNDSTEGTTTRQVTARDGSTTEVKIGQIRLSIAVGVSNAGQNLNALQSVGRSITGKTLPTSRLLIAMIIAVLSLIAIVTLTYASISSSIISVGRNPLAKYAIFRATGSVMSLVLLIAVLASASVFFLLR